MYAMCQLSFYSRFFFFFNFKAYVTVCTTGLVRGFRNTGRTYRRACGAFSFVGKPPAEDAPLEGTRARRLFRHTPPTKHARRTAY